MVKTTVYWREFIKLDMMSKHIENYCLNSGQKNTN